MRLKLLVDNPLKSQPHLQHQSRLNANMNASRTRYGRLRTERTRRCQRTSAATPASASGASTANLPRRRLTNQELSKCLKLASTTPVYSNHIIKYKRDQRCRHQQQDWSRRRQHLRRHHQLIILLRLIMIRINQHNNSNYRFQPCWSPCTTTGGRFTCSRQLMMEEEMHRWTRKRILFRT